MSDAFRCPECGSRNHVYAALNESLLAISSDLETETVLVRIVEAARRFVHASYGAVGISNDGTGFSHLIASGPSDEGGDRDLSLEAQAMLADSLREGPFTTPDITKDPAFQSWPDGFPDLRSFLGVPILNRGEVMGAFFLANENTWGFTPDDQALVELLASHAGLTIRNLRLHEQSRELSVIQERNRLARELHDSVTQTLFSMKLAADSADVLVSDDVEGARGQLAILKDLARHASKEMRSLIFELRPPELEIEGLVATLEKHIDALRKVHPVDIELRHSGYQSLGSDQDRELFRIVQEALNNAIRHGNPNTVKVELHLGDDKLLLSIADDGIGFDPLSPRPGARLGLISMRERAQALGTELTVSSQPGRGTVVELELAR